MPMNKPLDPNEKFVSIDGKDLFMSGDIYSLIDDTVESFTGRRKELIRRALFLLLDTQYICSFPSPVACTKQFVGRAWGSLIQDTLLIYLS